MNLWRILFRVLVGKHEPRMGPIYPWAVLTFPLPLRWALAILALAARRRRSIPPTVELMARRGLHITDDQLPTWFREAWWGHHAAIACKLRGIFGRHREIRDSLLEVDWSPLDTLLANGRGVVLVGCHFGPPQAFTQFAALSGHESISIGLGIQIRDSPDQAAVLSTRVNLPSLFMKAFVQVRNRGVAAFSPDGGVRTTIPVEYFGRPYKLGSGAATIAHRLNVPILPWYIHWQGTKLKMTFGEPIAPAGEEFDAWCQRWAASYVESVHAHVARHPRGIRFDQLPAKWARELAQRPAYGPG